MVQPGDFVGYAWGSKGRLDGIRNVLLCYDDDDFAAIVQHIARRGNIPSKTQDMVVLKNSPTAVVGRFGIGAPAVVARCEELIACGATRFISLGTAASIKIRKGIAIGDVVVCEKAFSDEGTSRHYLPGRRVFRATRRLVEEIYAHLTRQGLPCKTGAAWTTDAQYRETPRKRDAFRDLGASVVEITSIRL